MIDGIAILTTHILLIVAFYLVGARDDMDDEAPPGERHRGAGFGIDVNQYGMPQNATPPFGAPD